MTELVNGIVLHVIVLLVIVLPLQFYCLNIIHYIYAVDIFLMQKERDAVNDCGYHPAYRQLLTLLSTQYVQLANAASLYSSLTIQKFFYLSL